MKDLSAVGINDEVYNVKAYGAKGDDSTAEQVAFQAALDAAWRAGGGQVVVPKGIYRIMGGTGPLRIRSNVRLTLQPGAEVHRYNDSSSLVWNGDGSQNRAGWTGHGNITIDGGLWDMRCSTSTVALSNDDFTRSDTSAPHTLGVMTSGQTWINETSRGSGTEGTGCLGITSNTASAATAGTNISTVFGWRDGTVQVTQSTAGNAGVVFRLANSQNYMQYIRHTDNSARLSYFVNGTETVVTPDASVTVSTGHVMTVVMFGDRVRCFSNGTMTHDFTDTGTGLKANRKVGLVILDTTARLDTFVNTASMWADTFTRSNNASTLGTSSSGYAWTTQTGTLGINTNAAYAPSNGVNVATVDATSETNVQAQITTLNDTDGGAGIVFRYQDSNNYWWFRRHTDGNARLSKFVGGVETVITAAQTVSVTTNDTLYVKVNGWKIYCFVNYNADNFSAGTGTGSACHDTVDSDLYQATKVGLRIDDATARLDAFDCYAASGGYVSGACFNFGHAENLLFRDLTIRDVSAKSHAVEIAGCKNVLADNVTFLGMSAVTNRWSEAFQMDITKSNSYFAAFGPHDNTTNRDVIVRGCSFQRSYMPGTTAWQRGVGSHSSTIGAWHDHLRVTDNYFDCTEKSIRAYNWNNVFIRGNTISGGTGIALRSVDDADDADTTNLAGTDTNASQDLYNLQVEGNVLTVDGSTGSTVYAIHAEGESTGQVHGIVIRGNDIRSSTCGGIRVDYGEFINVTDNIVNSYALTDIGWHGIMINQSNNALVEGNNVFRAGSSGIYVTGASSNVRVLSNTVRGANRVNGSSSCYKSDGTCTDVTWGNNVARTWGSGTEPQYSLALSNGTHTRLDNDFVTGSSGIITFGTSTDTVPASAYRSMAIPFHVSGSVTTGVKAAKFIAPVAMTVVDMRAVLASGSGTTTIRPSKNDGSSDGTTQNVTTSTQSTTQTLALAAGDTLTVNVSAVGTSPTDLSVTFWANLT